MTRPKPFVTLACYVNDTICYPCKRNRNIPESCFFSGSNHTKFISHLIFSIEKQNLTVFERRWIWCCFGAESESQTLGRRQINIGLMACVSGMFEQWISSSRNKIPVIFCLSPNVLQYITYSTVNARYSINNPCRLPDIPSATYIYKYINGLSEINVYPNLRLACDPQSILLPAILGSWWRHVEADSLISTCMCNKLCQEFAPVVLKVEIFHFTKR